MSFMSLPTNVGRRKVVNDFVEWGDVVTLAAALIGLAALVFFS